MAILAEYAAYLVMGAGVLLILISVIYTYRVNRKMKIRYFENKPLNRPRAQKTDQSKQLLHSKKEMSNLNNELDKMIDELRDKETEIRILLNRIKDWDTEISEDGFSQILTKKMKSNTNETSNPTEPHQQEEKEAVLHKDAFAKNDEIIKLANQGVSITEIAQRLNLGYREVELIVKMTKKGAKTGA